MKKNITIGIIFFSAISSFIHAQDIIHLNDSSGAKWNLKDFMEYGITYNLIYKNDSKDTLNYWKGVTYQHQWHVHPDYFILENLLPGYYFCIKATDLHSHIDRSWLPMIDSQLRISVYKTLKSKNGYYWLRPRLEDFDLDGLRATVAGFSTNFQENCVSGDVQDSLFKFKYNPLQKSQKLKNDSLYIVSDSLFQNWRDYNNWSKFELLIKNNYKETIRIDSIRLFNEVTKRNEYLYKKQIDLFSFSQNKKYRKSRKVLKTDIVIYFSKQDGSQYYSKKIIKFRR